ncbi:MFS transporter [Plantactinospora siamensis]|uniref:MFS transporter n=1 Tax=Plantactinospora siamensis TaxID=555372 RepID=A0ABV6P4H2_9ACTN
MSRPLPDRRAARPSPWLPRLGRGAWLALGINALSCLGSGLTLPFLIVYLHQVRGFGLPTAGLILALSAVVGLVTTPLTGPLVDRVGSSRALVAGLVTGGLGIALYALATTVPLAVLAAVVYGCASGLMWNGFATLLTSLVAPAERGSVFALRYMSANVAFGAGALISGFVTFSARPGPYVAILLVDAASYLLFAVALIRLRSLSTGPPAPAGQDRATPAGREHAAPGGPEHAAAAGRERGDPAPAGDRREGYREVLRDRALLAALLVHSLLMVFALSQTNVTFAAWVTGDGSGSTRVVGLAFSVNIAVLLLAQLPAIRLARGRSRFAGAAGAAGLFAAAWVVLVLPTTLGLTGPGHDLLQIASLGVFALGEAMLSPTLPALVNDLAPERLRGRYNAVFSLSNQVGPVIAPVLAGLALGHALGQPYLYALAVACLATGGLALLVRRPIPRSADLGTVGDRRRPARPVADGAPAGAAR